jgi:threonine 3-dehydrogenase
MGTGPTFGAVVKDTPTEGGLSLRQMSPRRLGDDEVLIKVAAAGICGTDLKIWKWPAWVEARMAPHLPLTLGHEFCGYIEDIGSNCDAGLIGAYVAVESHIGCGTCAYCLDGREHICLNLRYVGLDVDGGLAEYSVVPCKTVHRLPAEIPVESAAMMEPFALATRAVISQSVVDRSVLISGLGPLGLMSMAVASASGAATVIGIERNPDRIEFARHYVQRMHNAVVLDSTSPGLDNSVADLVGGHGVDRWIDYSGAAQAISLGIKVIARGARVNLLGTAGKPVPVSLDEAIMKEVSFDTIHGRDRGCWPVAEELLSSGAVDLLPLVSHRFGLDGYHEAFELLFEGRACKVIIRPGS